jgi:hypothetical protein
MGRLMSMKFETPVRGFSFFLFGATCLIRLPFASKLLYDHDSVQFALATERYDVYLRQPHAPGYFLYVLAGKLLNGLTGNSNTSFVLIGILSGGLLTVAVFLLGTAVFDRRAGVWAAAVAISSPMLWFFSDVALSYAPAAAFAAWFVWICWRIRRGEDRWIYPSALVLAVGAGIRQDLWVFLLPLWIFSLRRPGWKRLPGPAALFCAATLVWLIPMLVMTGGAARYVQSVREQWEFFNSTFTVWNAPSIEYRGSVLLELGRYLLAGVGWGLLLILLGAYVAVRSGSWRGASREKAGFLAAWIAPALLFHLLIYPGLHYFLVIPLIVLLPAAVGSVAGEFHRLAGGGTRPTASVVSAVMAILVLLNAVGFVFQNGGYSAGRIRRHDRSLAVLFSGIREHFSPKDTVILDDKRSPLYTYRHIQYYLPEYRTYLTFYQSMHWHVWWAQDGRTHVSDEVRIPEDARYVVDFLDPSDVEYAEYLRKNHYEKIALDGDNALFFKKR